MLMIQTGHSEAIITSLNILSNIKTSIKSCQLKSHPEEQTSYLQEQINEVVGEMKGLLEIVRRNGEIKREMKAEITKLNRQKQRLLQRHRQELTKLQMLFYQNDYQDLKNKLGHYKYKNLQESSHLLSEQGSVRSFNSELDKAFVIDNDNNGQNQFLNTFTSYTKKSDRYNKALQVINSQSSPFWKKQQVWLDIVSPDSHSSFVEHLPFQQVVRATENKRQQSRQRRISEFSQITITEQFPKRLQQSDLYSGKKMKSMMLLKQRKKKSLSKTSTKKAKENHKDCDNIQLSQYSKSKKKLFFTNKVEKEGSKKRNGKSRELKPYKKGTMS